MPEKTNNNIFNQMAIDQAVILSKVSRIQTDLDCISTKLEKDYASKEWVNSEYGQIKKGFYGVISLILLAVIGAIVALVLK